MDTTFNATYRHVGSPIPPSHIVKIVDIDSIDDEGSDI